LDEHADPAKGEAKISRRSRPGYTGLFLALAIASGNDAGVVLAAGLQARRPGDGFPAAQAIQRFAHERRTETRILEPTRITSVKPGTAVVRTEAAGVVALIKPVVDHARTAGIAAIAIGTRFVGALSGRRFGEKVFGDRSGQAARGFFGGQVRLLRWNARSRTTRRCTGRSGSGRSCRRSRSSPEVGIASAASGRQCF
jgi:hypothetical protein